MRKNLFAVPVHPLFLGAYPVLFLWTINLGQISAAAVLPSLALALVFTGFVWAACLLALRKPHQGSLLASGLLLLFYLYGNVLNLISGKSLLGMQLGYARLLFGFALLGLALAIILYRNRLDLRPVTETANLVGGLLVLLALGQIVIYEARANAQERQPAVAVKASQTGSADQPDIYYIVLDSYLRSDALRSRFLYDNTAFVQGLRERGFYVADCAFSNYPKTSLSIASSLNMDYLEDLGIQNMGVFQEDAPPELQQMIHQNRVRQILARHGYQFAAFRGFFPINDIRDADYYFEAFEDEGWTHELAALNFEHMLVNTTMLRAAVEVYQQNPSAKMWTRMPMAVMALINPDSEMFSSRSYRWYRQHMYTFDTLETIPDLPGSIFTYAQIYAAHQPYVMNADGSFMWPINEDNYNYIPAVEYTSQRMLQVVDEILRKSTLPPVIIIQADHGTGEAPDSNKILNAYYLPEHTQALYPTITPVNTFRTVLSAYFGEDLPLLDDRAYMMNKANQVQVMTAECGR